MNQELSKAEVNLENQRESTNNHCDLIQEDIDYQKDIDLNIKNDIFLSENNQQFEKPNQKEIINDDQVNVTENVCGNNEQLENNAKIISYQNQQCLNFSHIDPNCNIINNQIVNQENTVIQLPEEKNNIQEMNQNLKQLTEQQKPIDVVEEQIRNEQKNVEDDLIFLYEIKKQQISSEEQEEDKILKQIKLENINYCSQQQLAEAKINQNLIGYNENMSSNNENQEINQDVEQVAQPYINKIIELITQQIASLHNEKKKMNKRLLNMKELKNIYFKQVYAFLKQTHSLHLKELSSITLKKSHRIFSFYHCKHKQFQQHILHMGKLKYKKSKNLFQKRKKEINFNKMFLEGLKRYDNKYVTIHEKKQQEIMQKMQQNDDKQQQIINENGLQSQLIQNNIEQFMVIGNESNANIIEKQDSQFQALNSNSIRLQQPYEQSQNIPCNIEQQQYYYQQQQQSQEIQQQQNPQLYFQNQFQPPSTLSSTETQLYVMSQMLQTSVEQQKIQQQQIQLLLQQQQNQNYSNQVLPHYNNYYLMQKLQHQRNDNQYYQFQNNNYNQQKETNTHNVHSNAKQYNEIDLENDTLKEKQNKIESEKEKMKQIINQLLANGYKMDFIKKEILKMKQDGKFGQF